MSEYKHLDIEIWKYIDMQTYKYRGAADMEIKNYGRVEERIYTQTYGNIEI